MNILGLSLSPHDSSAAVIKNGKISIAIEEEKISRIRHCIKYNESKYTLKDEAEYFDSNFLNPNANFIKVKIDKFIEYFKIKSFNTQNKPDLIIGSNILGTAVPIKGYVNVNHHLAHAAHAFYTSPYNEAAVLVIDGSGNSENNRLETISMYIGKGNNLKLLEKVTGQINHSTNTIIALSNSVGVVYQNASVLCGFGPFGEGKLMGLASYGKPKYLDSCMKFCHKHNSYYEIDNLHLFNYIKKTVANNNEQENIANIAASIQELVSKLVLFYAKRLQKITKQKNLCYAGGVALNAITNTKILDKAGFKHVYIPSAPGDNGTSIGAALYGYYQIYKNKRVVQSKLTTAYMGKKYSYEEVEDSVNKYKGTLNLTNLKSEKEVIEVVANLLSKNKIIAWFQGESEFGPRALGHRSIFASPMIKTNRDRLNKIKNRESFRPVAPIINLEKVSDYFRVSKKTSADSLSYMLFTLSPLNEKTATIIPAVIHVDSTARVQVISKEQNLMVHNLINKFAKLTKVPVLINTSFNIKGEPMVETPDDALKTFIMSDIDCLILNNYLIKKI